MRSSTAYVFLIVYSMPVSVSAQGTPEGWTTFRDQSGTSVQYPRAVFSQQRQSDDGRGTVFLTEDGRARLEVFTVRNDRSETPAQYLRRVFPKDRGDLDYDRVARNFFAVSEEKDTLILYRRCNFSRDLIHCMDIRYPQREKRAWDKPVTRLSLSLRPR